MSSFTDFLAAIEHGAASVYSQVLATGTEIAAWGSDASVAPLLSIGASVANAALEKVGLSNVANVVEADVATGLKTIAAADPTVPSLGSISALVGLAGSVVSDLVPGAGAVIAGVEGAVGLAESLATTTTTTTTTIQTPTPTPTTTASLEATTASAG